MIVSNSLPILYGYNRNKYTQINNSKPSFGSFEMSGDVLDALHYIPVSEQCADTILSLAKESFHQNVQDFANFTDGLGVNVKITGLSESLKDHSVALLTSIKCIGEADTTAKDIPISMGIVSSFENLKEFLSDLIRDPLTYIVPKPYRNLGYKTPPELMSAGKSVESNNEALSNGVRHINNTSSEKLATPSNEELETMLKHYEMEPITNIDQTVEDILKNSEMDKFKLE